MLFQWKSLVRTQWGNDSSCVCDEKIFWTESSTSFSRAIDRLIGKREREKSELVCVVWENPTVARNDYWFVFSAIYIYKMKPSTAKTYQLLSLPFRLHRFYRHVTRSLGNMYESTSVFGIIFYFNCECLIKTIARYIFHFSIQKFALLE